MFSSRVFAPLTVWIVLSVSSFTAIQAIETISQEASQELGAPSAFDIRELGLGERATVIVVFCAECQRCIDSIPFYKRLASAAGSDDDRTRFLVLTVGGVIPASNVLKRCSSRLIE